MSYHNLLHRYLTRLPGAAGFLSIRAAAVLSRIPTAVIQNETLILGCVIEKRIPA